MTFRRVTLGSIFGPKSEKERHQQIIKNPVPKEVRKLMPKGPDMEPKRLPKLIKNRYKIGYPKKIEKIINIETS